jgi:hypothetical protein
MWATRFPGYGLHLRSGASVRIQDNRFGIASFFTEEYMIARRIVAKRVRCCLLLIVAVVGLMALPSLHAQTTAALSGRVVDTSQAEVVGAKVTVINQDTNDKLDTVTAKDGTYSFPVLLPGTYTVLVEAKGFKASKQEGLVVYSGARDTVPDSVLSVGSVAETVTVETNSQILLTDNGSLGSTLDSKDIEQLALVTRNADELLKILPGATIVPGTGNGPLGETGLDVETSPAATGVNYNGEAHNGGTSELYDGVDIGDPGCWCNTLEVVDADHVQEVTVLTSSYGADVAHGPVIINNISKSGSDKYHGEGYFFVRNDVLNTNDWQSNHNNTPKGKAHYYYPGGNIGGPVPFTKKKLQFWFGYEKFLQNTGNASTLTSYIPSADMLGGNFTATAANAALCGNTGISSTVKNTYCNDLTGTVLPDGSIIGVTPGRPAGMIPAMYLNTAAAKDGLALTKIWPAANVTPNASNSYQNFYLPVPGIHDGYIYRARVDYNFSDRTKFYASFQDGTDSQPASGAGAHLYWTPGNSIPFPGGALVGSNVAKALAGHLLHTFSNTLTNEAIATLSDVHNDAAGAPNVSAVYKTTNGYAGSAVFNNGDPWIPSYGSPNNQTYPDFSQGDQFTNGGYQLVKPTTSLEDNLVKVWGAHTLKTGVFYEMTDNFQDGFGNPNGTLSFSAGGGVNNNAVSGSPMGSPNNPLANMLLGNAVGFSQTSSNPPQDLAEKIISFYADDSWKATKRLSVEYGVRFDHIGRWYDRGPAGVPVFVPARVASDFAAGVVNPGLQYHGINPGIPKSGLNSTFLLLSPRFGVSYDVFGTGKTLVRGGIGIYRWGDSWNDIQGGVSVAQGVQTFNLPGSTSVTLDQIGTTYAPKTAGSSGSIQNAMDANDNGNPTSYNYNLTITQRLPWNMLVEASYVGNQSQDALLGGGNGVALGSGNGIINVNKTPLGAFFKPDPVTGITAPNPENVTRDLNNNPLPNKPADYHPYGYAYGTNTVGVMEHLGYSNYNAFQISLVKRSSHLNFNLNYTRSKTLATTLSENPFSLRGDYGVDNDDRPYVLNTSFAYDDHQVYHGDSRLISGAVNNWEVSAITTFQSGANLQAISSQNFSLNTGYVNVPAGLTGVGTGLGANTWYGTDAGVSIQPTLTCSPTSGRGPNQYLTDKCFALPAFGAYGPRNYPYIKGPAYFDSDLALAKKFHITENHTVEFRASAFNWLNHPQNDFSGNQLKLIFNTDYTSKTSTLSTQTVPNFGTTVQKAGGDSRRLVELSVKYAF